MRLDCKHDENLTQKIVVWNRHFGTFFANFNLRSIPQWYEMCMGIPKDVFWCVRMFSFSMPPKEVPMEM